MQMLSLTGGAPLWGEVNISGAKNSVLPILAALLCRGTCELRNVPEIEDVSAACRILRSLGCRTVREHDRLLVDAAEVSGSTVNAELAGCMRSSVLFAGALLARTGSAEVGLPGGCPLGLRPVDYHIRAFRELGAEAEQRPDAVVCRRGGASGGTVQLPFPSVGATENALLAAVGLGGHSEIRGAAREPEITELAEFLISAGADISGVGTSCLCIEGGRPLHGVSCAIRPDRIETATYLCACAACGGSICLTDAEEQTLLPVTDVLRQTGCSIRQMGRTLKICAPQRLKAPEGIISTAPYPGFPTDAQALIMAALLRAEGSTVLEETIFENRFRHVPQMRRLGAHITVSGCRAQVLGTPQLTGAFLEAEDLRGGASLVLAALSAEGKSTITGINHLRRGYDHLEEKLRSLGADIKTLENAAAG